MQSMADERLLRALAEQLKLPLTQIARMSEAGPGAELHIRQVADAAIRLVDGYLLSSQLHNQQSLELEPVSLSSVLADTAYTLMPLAAEHNCDISVSLGGKYGPVMAHRESLSSALLLLGYSLIEERPRIEQRHEVVLGVHKSARGLVAGVFDNQPGLSMDVFRRGRAIYGSARTSMPPSSSVSGAGVFVADALLGAMSAPLKVARHHKLTGLAATLHPGAQLQLV